MIPRFELSNVLGSRVCRATGSGCVVLTTKQINQEPWGCQDPSSRALGSKLPRRMQYSGPNTQFSKSLHPVGNRRTLFCTIPKRNQRTSVPTRALHPTMLEH